MVILVIVRLLKVDEIEHKNRGEEGRALCSVRLFGEDDGEHVRIGVHRSGTSLPAALDQANLLIAVGRHDLELDYLASWARALAEKSRLVAVAAGADAVPDLAVRASDVQNCLAAVKGVEHVADHLAGWIENAQRRTARTKAFPRKLAFKTHAKNFGLRVRFNLNSESALWTAVLALAAFRLFLSFEEFLALRSSAGIQCIDLVFVFRLETSHDLKQLNVLLDE